MHAISRAHTVLLAGAALLLAQSGIAVAQDAPNERVAFASPYTISTVPAGPHQAGKVAVSLPVSYADLDLNSATGVEAFKSRVKDAARKVCRQIDLRDRGTMADSAACVEAAAGSALEKAGTIVASRTGTAKLAALP